MKLGVWLKKYREKNNMTMQDMANLCGFSKSYVSMLEKGINSTTNKPVSPTIQTLEKIARATGQDVDSLLKILDGEQPVTIHYTNINKKETELLASYRNLNLEGQNILLGVLKSLANTYPASTSMA